MRQRRARHATARRRAPPGRPGRDGDPFVVAAFEFRFEKRPGLGLRTTSRPVALDQAPGHVWFTFERFKPDRLYMFKGVTATAFGDITARAREGRPR